MSNVLVRRPSGAPLGAGDPLDAGAALAALVAATVVDGAALAAGAALAGRAEDGAALTPPVAAFQLSEPPPGAALGAAEEGAALAAAGARPVAPWRGAPRCCANAVAPIATKPSEKHTVRRRMVRESSSTARSASRPDEHEAMIAVRRPDATRDRLSCTACSERGTVRVDVRTWRGHAECSSDDGGNPS